MGWVSATENNSRDGAKKLAFQKLFSLMRQNNYWSIQKCRRAAAPTIQEGN